MRKIILVLVVALVAAAPASAKEIVGLTVCGASGCETERGPAISSTLHEGPMGPLAGTGEAVAPATPGAWYRGYVLLGDHGKVFGRLPFYYVPGGGLIVQPGQGAQTTTWQKADPTWLSPIERLAARVEPFPTPTIVRVSLNGENATDPQSYLALYSAGSKAKTYPKSAEATQIVLESKRRSPWTDGNNLILYPKEHLLVRDGQMVSIPAAMSSAVAAHASLADDGRTIPWTTIAVAALLAALVGAAAVVAVRRGAPGRRPEAGTA
jgi:hypothetical protein